MILTPSISVVYAKRFFISNNVWTYITNGTQKRNTEGIKIFLLGSDFITTLQNQNIIFFLRNEKLILNRSSRLAKIFSMFFLNHKSFQNMTFLLLLLILIRKCWKAKLPISLFHLNFNLKKKVFHFLSLKFISNFNHHRTNHRLLAWPRPRP